MLFSPRQAPHLDIGRDAAFPPMSDASMTHATADIKCLKCGSLGRRVACPLSGEMLYCSTRCLREDEDTRREPCELFRTIVRPAFTNVNVARLFIGFLDMADFYTCQVERERAAIEECLAGVAAKDASAGDATAAAAAVELSEPQPGEVDLRIREDPMGEYFNFCPYVVDATFGGSSGVSECPVLRFLPTFSKADHIDPLLLPFARAAVRDLQRAGLKVRFLAFDLLFRAQRHHSQLYTVDGVPVFSSPPSVLISCLYPSVARTFTEYSKPLTAFITSPPLFQAAIEAVRWPRFARHATGGHLVPSPSEQWVADWVRWCLWERRTDLAALLDAKIDEDMAKLKSKGKAIDKGVLVQQQLARLQRDTVADFMRVVDSLRTAEPKDAQEVISFDGNPPAATATKDEQVVCDRLAEEIRKASDTTEMLARVKDFERSIRRALAINDIDDLLGLIYQIDSYMSLHIHFGHWERLLKESTDLWRLMCLKVKQNSCKTVKDEASKFIQNMTEGIQWAQQNPSCPPPKRPKVFMDLNCVDSKGDNIVRRVVITLYTDVNPKAAENFRCYCTGEKGTGTAGYPLHYKHSAILFAIKGSDLVGGYMCGGNVFKMSESIYGENYSRWDHRRSLIAPRRPGLVVLVGEKTSTKTGIQSYREHGGRFLITVSSANSCETFETVVGYIDDMVMLAHLHAISIKTEDKKTPKASSSSSSRDRRLASLGEMSYGPQRDLVSLSSPIVVQHCGELPDE
ncbi:unnamed protein product [Vitrella brassicaformis CCMP3155]|uniref:PPIase cyclophilin-type domain-containing protein n=2 Tax=Vitrella brassicaformis TaxID=1169539 RepID=A0A0G4GL47_VITBC|nr:unnamed protein product [Vitrella brassicaformis CCMP3155]|eukprot:CEM30748.1 unnamed protein product [Vitrella brassicaformis CCMP3155]